MILGLLGGMLSILLTQLVVAAAFVGLGLGLRRGFGLAVLGLDDCFLAFWMGLAVVTLFLILWNFLLPVNAAPLILVVAAGLIGTFGARRDLARVFEQERWRPPLWLVVCLTLAVVWVANLSLGPLKNWDSSLYHLQGVRWAQEFPVVPGLVNLYGPLGFNNAGFLYFAMLGIGPWAGRAYHLGNGLLISAILVQLLVAGARFLGDDPERRPRQLFAFLFLPLVLDLTAGDRVSSYVTDLGPSLVTVALMIRWYARLTVAQREPAEDAYDLVCLTTLAALATSLKFNSAVFGAVSVVVAAGLWQRRRPPDPGLLKKTRAWSVGWVLAFGLAWSARGVVLSGYPLFPSRLLSFPVDWRAPAEHADAEFAYIAHSSRASVDNFPVVSGRAGFLSWFPGWARNALQDPFIFIVPVVLALLAAVLYRQARRHAAAGGGPGATGGVTRWMLLPIAVALVAWFLVSPELRYVTQHFWALAALAGAQAFALQPAQAKTRLPRQVFALVGVLAIAPPLVIPALRSKLGKTPSGPLRAILDDAFTRPGSDHAFPQVTSPKLGGFETKTGLLLNVPLGRGHCWNAPLPCTPNPAPNLRLRVAGRMENGFAVDGPWQMINWPYSWRAGFLPAWRESRH